MHDVAVRLAGPADLPAVAALRWQWRAERVGAQPGPDQAAFAGAFAAWATANAATHRCFVAELSATPVGMAWLALVPRVPSPHSLERRTGDVQSVFVLPEHRRRGIATALLDAVIEAARADRVERLVVHSSTLAVDLYDRAGFRSSVLLRDRRMDA